MFYPTITTISLSSHTILDLYTPRPPDDAVNDNQEKMKDDSEKKETEQKNHDSEGKHNLQRHSPVGDAGMNHNNDQKKKVEEGKDEDEENDGEDIKQNQKSPAAAAKDNDTETHCEENVKKQKIENNTNSSKRATEESDCHSQPSSLQNRYIGSLLLAPRSLLILQDSLYTSHLHGIAEVTEDSLTHRILNLDQQRKGKEWNKQKEKEDNCQGEKGEEKQALNEGTPLYTPGHTLARSTRISLTIRHVPKVLKTKLWLGRGQR